MPALLIWMIQVQSLMWKCIWRFWRMNKLYIFKAMLYLFISVIAISQLLRHELLSVSCSECCSKSSIAVCRALQTFLGFSVCICLLHILYYVCGCLAGHLYRMEGDPSSEVQSDPPKFKDFGIHWGALLALHLGFFIWGERWGQGGTGVCCFTRVGVGLGTQSSRLPPSLCLWKACYSLCML